VTHLEGNGVEFYQFAFRWMNCLLMRELPFQLVIRLWDTCLAERDGCVSLFCSISSSSSVGVSGVSGGSRIHALARRRALPL
jgi:hypothetical protein